MATRQQDDRIYLLDMVPGDLDEVMAIEDESFPVPWSRNFFERELALKFSRTFIAREGGVTGEVMGYAVVWFVADELHLLNIAVAPQHRRKGAARLLLERVIGEARERECELVVLEVRKSGMPAQKLYQSMGFAPVGIRPRYYSDNGEDAIVMVCRVGIES